MSNDGLSQLCGSIFANHSVFSENSAPGKLVL
jgi:hypothetical protein